MRSPRCYNLRIGLNVHRTGARPWVNAARRAKHSARRPEIRMLPDFFRNLGEKPPPARSVTPSTPIRPAGRRPFEVDERDPDRSGTPGDEALIRRGVAERLAPCRSTSRTQLWPVPREPGFVQGDYKLSEQLDGVMTDKAAAWFAGRPSPSPRRRGLTCWSRPSQARSYPARPSSSSPMSGSRPCPSRSGLHLAGLATLAQRALRGSGLIASR